MIDDEIEIPDLPFYTVIGTIDTEQLFAYAVAQNCSDIHIKPNAPVKLRINGELLPIEGMPALSPDDVESIINSTQNDEQMALFDHNRFGLNYAFEIAGVGRFRMNVLKTRYNTALIARHLIDKPPTFEELNANPVIADLARFRTGLILFSGETGSGKTTLMAAMIQKINSERACNIISAEDPIEIVHQDLKSSVIQREVGTDVASFNDALVDALREDPDVILIGEIREEAEAKAALRAAETGHLVISTVHGINAVASINRLLERFPFEEREGAKSVLAGALRGIVCQRLVPTKDGKKRVAANEILLNTPKMQAALEDKTTLVSDYAQIVETSSEDGMQTFEQHLAELYRTDMISRQSALEEATDEEKMETLLLEVDELKEKHVEKPVTPQAPHIPFSRRAGADEEHHRATAAPAYDVPKRPSFQLPPRA